MAQTQYTLDSSLIINKLLSLKAILKNVFIQAAYIPADVYDKKLTQVS